MDHAPYLPDVLRRALLRLHPRNPFFGLSPSRFAHLPARLLLPAKYLSLGAVHAGLPAMGQNVEIRRAGVGTHIYIYIGCATRQRFCTRVRAERCGAIPPQRRHTAALRRLGAFGLLHRQHLPPAPSPDAPLRTSARPHSLWHGARHRESLLRYPDAQFQSHRAYHIYPLLHRRQHVSLLPNHAPRARLHVLSRYPRDSRAAHGSRAHHFRDRRLQSR